MEHTPNPILLVDPDRKRAIEAADSLSKSISYSIFPTHDFERASSWLQSNSPSLVVLEVMTPHEPALNVLRHLHNNWPGIPVVLTLNTDMPRLHLLNLPQLVRPFSMNRFVREVRFSLQSGLDGTLLTDLLLSHTQFGCSGSVHVTSENDYGEIGFLDGEFIHAGTHELVGREALASILTWKHTRVSKLNGLIPRKTMDTKDAEGLIRFALKTHHSKPGPRLPAATMSHTARETITFDTESTSAPPLQTLLDTLSMEDELLSLTPITLDEGLEPGIVTASGDYDLPVDDALSGEFISIHAWDDELLTQPNPKENFKMSNNITASLDQFKSLNGYVGVSLVDSDSGMMLGHDGGGAINMDVAAAANSEVVKAKRQAIKHLKLKEDIDDILITLDSQYHLIRPFKKRPSLFFYLVLDRSRSNLALARMELSDVEDGLQL